MSMPKLQLVQDNTNKYESNQQKLIVMYLTYKICLLRPLFSMLLSPNNILQLLVPLLFDRALPMPP